MHTYNVNSSVIFPVPGTFSMLIAVLTFLYQDTLAMLIADVDSSVNFPVPGYTCNVDSSVDFSVP